MSILLNWQGSEIKKWVGGATLCYNRDTRNERHPFCRFVATFYFHAIWRARTKNAHYTRAHIQHINESPVQFIAYHPLPPPNVLSIESNKNRHRFASCLLLLSFLRSYFTFGFVSFGCAYIECSGFHSLFCTCVFSPIMFNHFRAALFIPSIFHSFVISRGYTTDFFLGWFCLLVNCYFVPLFSSCYRLQFFWLQSLKCLSSRYFSMFQRLCRKLDNCNKNYTGLDIC